VAEGVEDVATLKLLAKYGCDYAQGYGIAHPLGLADALAWLRNAALPAAPLTPPAALLSIG
jgi:diguanylate cyclase